MGQENEASKLPCVSSVCSRSTWSRSSRSTWSRSTCSSAITRGSSSSRIALLSPICPNIHKLLKYCRKTGVARPLLPLK